jgi:hypothetical protein
MTSETLTKVTMKYTAFLDASTCIPIEVYRHFGRTYSLHLQGRKTGQERKEQYGFSHSLRSNIFFHGS